jgi:hypothetical protein
MLSVRESQMPRKKGYAMKAIKRMAPGSIRMMPRFLSRSKKSLMEKDFELARATAGDMLSGRFKNPPSLS